MSERDKIRECPYCGTSLEPENAWYVLTWVNGEQYKQDTFPELKNLLRQYDVVSEIRKVARYEKVWLHYNYGTIDEVGFQPEEYILRQEEVRSIIEVLSRENGEGEQEAEDDSFYDTLGPTSFVSPLLASRQTEGKPAGRPDKEEETAYFYTRKNPDSEFDLQGDISVGIVDRIVAKVSRVCSHCYNLTPDDLYNYPMVKVYLMATPGSGKTCMLYSLFLNKDNFNINNKHRMEWESIQDANVDVFFKHFYENMEVYKKTKRTDPTRIQFIPPLFMKVTYRGEKETKTVILALFDNGGEIFNTKGVDENAAKLFNLKIKRMDALLCLVNLESKNKYGMKLSEASVKRVLDGCTVLTREKQNRVESRALEAEMTIGELLMDMLQDDSLLEQGNADDIVGALNASSRAIIESLQRRLGSEDQMKEIVRDKYFALIISKIDCLENSTMIEEQERDLFFDRVPYYFTEEERQRKLERNRKMKKWQKDGILVGYNLRNFRNINYHYVAAHIDCDKDYARMKKGIEPIRIEEPIIGIVEDYMFYGRG